MDSKPFLKIVVGLWAILSFLSATSCIRSRVVITSEPPEATVTFQHLERGDTPIEIPINWYWFYDIELAKDGFEPFKTQERFRCKPWLIFPLDLVAEIMPFPIDDTRRVHYNLTPLEEKATAPGSVEP